jgi:hypothetical protein
MYPVQLGRPIALKRVCTVEGLYCKRPIQCLASSEILTSPPHPLTARRVCNPPPLVRGEDTLAGWRRGGGSIVFGRLQTLLCTLQSSTYVSTLWSVRSLTTVRE